MENYENEFDALVDCLKSMPRAKVKMLNISRYLALLKTAGRLQNYLVDTVAPDKLEIKTDTDLGYGCITVEADEFIASKPSDLLDILEPASNFEIYPLNNGNIRLSIVFHSVL